ncbi:MAG: ABC transporter ATP-binding protein [Syntrophales bacterium]|nr:ABC transporter ATP-binding protein [Syntrophales bacterium]
MISIDNVSIQLGKFGLRDINITIEKNEFFILMGPTGAGKTVLLEAIAGLIRVDSGHIHVNGRNITKFPPEKRGISIVYQDYSLFPHLTVRDNITYGLHFHKVAGNEAKKRFDRLVEELNLSHLLQRLPTNLSGGENQRIALARALIVSPKVLLLDEPLSALDPGFREGLRKRLKSLHESTNVTFLMVTHDFSEALSLADRAAVMDGGEIKQVGKMKEIFQRPNSAFVADFVGMKNLFTARFCDTKAVIEDLEIELGRPPENGHGHIAIRPEDVVISREKLSSSMRNSFMGRVAEIMDQGLCYEVSIAVKDVLFKSLITKSSLFDLEVREGSDIYLSFKSMAMHTF